MGGIENFRYHSENFTTVAKFRYGSEISLCEIANFFFLKNKIT